MSDQLDLTPFERYVIEAMREHPAEFPDGEDGGVYGYITTVSVSQCGPTLTDYEFGAELTIKDFGGDEAESGLADGAEYHREIRAEAPVNDTPDQTCPDCSAPTYEGLGGRQCPECGWSE